MANRPVEKDAPQGGQEAARKAAAQLTQATRTMADAGERTARVGAEAMQRNSENLRDTLHSGSEIASSLLQHSIGRFSESFGFTGERAQQTIQQSSRNMQAILETTATLSGGAQDVSQEWMNFVRKRVQQTLEHFDALANCRTPQELVALQTDLVRANLEEFLHSSRRASEILVKFTDEAARKMSDTSLAPR